MQTYFAALALALIPVWVAVEAAGKAFSLSVRAKELLCVAVGAAFGIVGHGSGLVLAPGAPPWDWGMAVLGGVIVGMGAGAFNDYVVKPLTPQAKP